MTGDTDTADQTRGKSPYESVLIFDGECPFCSAAASALRRVQGAGAVEWDNQAATAFLSAQFNDVPFALVYVDPSEDTVWIGRDAARELCERAGVPVLVSDIVGEKYESIADAIRFVAGGDREPDPYHGSFELTDEARERFSDLAASARRTHIPQDDGPTRHSRG